MPNILLYQSTAEPIRLVKDSFLTPTTPDPNGQAIPIPFTCKDETDILNPVLTLYFDGDTTPIIKANYCYIPEWSRYYYIRDISIINTGLWRLSLHVDVLMSHRDDITNITCICTRNRDVYNSYLIDDRVPLQNNYNVQYISGTGSPLIPVTATGAGDFVYVATVVRGEAQQ